MDTAAGVQPNCKANTILQQGNAGKVTSECCFPCRAMVARRRPARFQCCSCDCFHQNYSQTQCDKPVLPEAVFGTWQFLLVDSKPGGCSSELLADAARGLLAGLLWQQHRVDVGQHTTCKAMRKQHDVADKIPSVCNITDCSACN